MPNDRPADAVGQTAYPFKCPWCEYEFRKERYLGPHIFEEHPEKVTKDVE